MKKHFTVILLTVLFCLTLSCAHAAGNDNARHDDRIEQGAIAEYERIKLPIDALTEETVVSGSDVAPVFRLPSSLLVIEDEAFEGTSITSLELPDGVESVGEKAFANIPTLRSIRVPTSTKYIAKSAFYGSHHVTITGETKSYAKTWARENGIPFTPILVICADHGFLQISANQEHVQYGPDSTESTASMDRHSQWRPLSETKADLYEEVLATCIPGRAPPA